MKQKPKRAAIYARISGANDGLSYKEWFLLYAGAPNISLDNAISYAEEQGYILLDEHIYEEDSTDSQTEKLEHRSALSNLREAMRKGEFDIILIESIEDISTFEKYQLIFRKEAEKAGVSIEIISY